MQEYVYSTNTRWGQCMSCEILGENLESKPLDVNWWIFHSIWLRFEVPSGYYAFHLQDQRMANFLQPFMFSTMPEYAFVKNDMRMLVKVEWQLSDSFKGRQYCCRNSNTSTSNFLLLGKYKGDYRSAVCYTDASVPEGTERGHRWWITKQDSNLPQGFILLGFNRIPYIALSDEVEWTMLTFLSKKIARMKIYLAFRDKNSFQRHGTFRPRWCIKYRCSFS